MPSRESGPRRVYSTGPEGGASTPVEPAGVIGEVLPPERHDVRVRRERSGRRGKTVTVAGPFLLGREEARTLFRQWKKACGSGGALKARDEEFWLEIQGDHVERLVSELQRSGFPAKRAGG